jgi:glycosyltransferase involved in cell wall biosynthesis
VNETLLVQTLFCPTRKMFETQLRSMRSLGRYLQQHPMQADICFAGFVDDEYHDELLAAVKALFHAQKCALYRLDRNYGKAFAVNAAVKRALQRTPGYRYLLTFDSDICFEPSGPRLLERLIGLSGKVAAARGKAFGLIACNFTGENVHWLDKFDNRQEIDGEVVSWPSQPAYPGGGIAGGCIFVGMDSWLKVGGYRTVGVYAPDDGYLMIDMDAAGYYTCVAETVLVHHPASSDDPGYARSKHEAMRHLSIKLHEGAGVDFDADVKSWESFWKHAKQEESPG